MGIRTDIYRKIAGFLWGFAEATFFFLVPDIWLTRVALSAEKKDILFQICLTVCGAICGGVVVYGLAACGGERIFSFYDDVPAISGEMIGQVGESLSGGGLFPQLVIGMLSGIPYKLYAAWAGILSLPVFYFILASGIARFLRFFLVSFLTYYLAGFLRRYVSARVIGWLHILFWGIFYICYFSFMG